MIHQKIERGILHNLWSGRTRDKMTKSFVVHLVILSPPYQTWDLSICLYLNLKHGNLDQSTTVLEAECSKLTKLRQQHMLNEKQDE